MCLFSTGLAASEPSTSNEAALKPGQVTLTDFSKPAEVKAIALSPDGKTIAVISPKGDYGTVLVFIDTATLKATAGFTDTGERVPGQVEWANNDRVILSVERKYGGYAEPQLTGELVGVNRDGTRVKPLFGGDGEKQLGSHIKNRASDQGYAFLADPLINDAKFALITVNAFSTDGSFTELHRMNEDTGAHTRLVRAPMRSASFLLDHAAAPRFAYAVGVDALQKVYRRDGDEWQIVADESKDGGRLSPLSYARDDKSFYAFFKVSASNNSGEYYLFDLKKRTAKFMFPLHSWMDPAQIAKTTPFELKARDGLLLHGYLTLPNVELQKNLPLVVMPHGGPHGRYDDDRYDDWAQVLASRGYAVLKVNFRGSGGYGTEFELAGYRQWGRAMQDDVSDATKWAVKQGFADANRIAIAGASYGGYAALMGAVREPDLYRAIISYAGVSDLELMYTRGDIEDSLYGENFLKRVLSEDRAELKNRSPVNLAAQFHAPVLIIHGGRDQRVPVIHGRSMRDALKAANKIVEYFEITDEMHGFFKQNNKQEAYTRMLAFLDKYLTVPATAKP